ncbi:MAG: hypothetical protein ACXV4B_01805 [Halobacteriota archaeon]
MATRDPLDGTALSNNVGGRPPALKSEHIAVLHDVLTERAYASLQEIADELHHPCGLRLKPVRGAYAERAEGVKRYGYTAGLLHLSFACHPHARAVQAARMTTFLKVSSLQGMARYFSRRVRQPNWCLPYGAVLVMRATYRALTSRLYVYECSRHERLTVLEHRCAHITN